MSLKQKYLQFSFIVQAILDNVLNYFCQIHLIKWDFLGKPHARLLTGRELSFACFSFYSKFICWLFNTYMNRHNHTYTHTLIRTHILSGSHSHTVTHTLRHRESERVRLSQRLNPINPARKLTRTKNWPGPKGRAFGTFIII